jgi:hypothetical protein
MFVDLERTIRQRLEALPPAARAKTSLELTIVDDLCP